MAAPKSPRVLIIGAGSAGLLTAHALQMQGAHVTVFERDAALDSRPRDWDFGIYWAQVPLAECLPEELHKEVDDAQVDRYRAGADEVMPIYNGLTEELMTKLPIPYNIRLKRRKFLRVITKGVDVKYSKGLKNVSSDGKTATAHFEDGTSETGDLLIGAEGAHSVVREHLLGAEKSVLSDTPVVATLGIAKLSAEAIETYLKYGNRMVLMFHPGGFFSWVGKHDAMSDDPSEWKFLVAQSWAPGDDTDYDTALWSKDHGAVALADAKRRAKNFGPNFSSFWQSIPDGTQMWHNRLTDWKPDAWDNHSGTVTLVGDAAHSMTFHRGQGLNNAIHDAASLSRCTREHGFTPAAIDAYEKEVIPRGQEAVVASRANTIAVHDWETLLESPLFKMGLKSQLK